MAHKKSFLPSVVILRGIAAFLVVCYHVAGREPYPIFNRFFGWMRDFNIGFLGVVCFFVISGFALSHALGNDYLAKDFGRFMARRLVRIEPTYFASIIISSLIIVVLTRIAPHGIPWLPSGKQLLANVLYLVPFTNQEWISLVYWTLAVEFQFYLTIGLIYPLLLSAGRKSNYGIPLCVMLFAALGLLWFLCPPLGLLKYTPFFALGILLERQLVKPMPGWLFYGTAGVICGMALMSKMPCIATIVGALTFMIIYHWQPEFKQNNWLVKVGLFLGTISYSWYVVHLTVITAGESAARFLQNMKYFPGQTWAVNLVPFVSFTASVLAAWGLYWLVERPTHRLARKISLRPRTQIPPHFTSPAIDR